MKIDLTEILNGRKNSISFAYCFDESALKGMEYALLPDDVKLLENGISVTGTVTDNNGYMTLRADVSAEYETMCARCLDPLRRTCAFSIDRIIRSGSALSSADVAVGTDEEWDGVTEDLLYLSDSSVNPDCDIMEMLALNLPLYHLCREDCEGLCPICGKKRAEGSCTCLDDEKNKKEIDPRLAKLKKLLEKDENI